MKQVVGIGLPIIATVLILTLSGKTQKLGVTFSDSVFINQQVNYQIGIFIFAILITGITVFISPDSKSLLALGKLNANTAGIKWLGIKEGSNWLKEGLALSLVITITTGAFLYFTMKNQIGSISPAFKVIGWIVLLAAFNAISEELIYRFAVIGNLKSLFTTQNIAIISAVIFGIAHIFGTPSGLIGLLLAGILGFVLSISVYETHGLFWAWFIHFLQDILIIGTLYLRQS